MTSTGSASCQSPVANPSQPRAQTRPLARPLDWNQTVLMCRYRLIPSGDVKRVNDGAPEVSLAGSGQPAAHLVGVLQSRALHAAAGGQQSLVPAVDELLELLHQVLNRSLPALQLLDLGLPGREGREGSGSDRQLTTSLSGQPPGAKVDHCH